MIFLPLVERELRVRARRSSTFRVRMVAAATACVFAMLVLLAGEYMLNPGNAGQFLFYVLGGMSFVYCLLEGVRTTSDSLSEEKRSGTIGLLFLTDLKGYDVVLGKLMATSLDSIYRLFAIVPALALPIVLGGITGSEFWRLVLLLANTLLFSLAVGLFASSISYHERKAGITALSLIGGITLLPPIVPAFVGGGLLVGLSPSPLSSFLALPDRPFSANPNGYWHSMAGVHFWTWAFAAMASMILPRNWQAVAPIESRRRRNLRQREAPLAPTRPPMQNRLLLDVHPTLWLAHRAMGSAKAIWWLVLGAGVAALFLNAITGNPAVLFATAMILHFVLAVWAASDASHALSGGRDSGALELLLTTPLKMDEIIRGYHQALYRKFSGPVWALIVLETVSLIAYATVMGVEEEDPLAGLLAFGFLGILLGVSLLDIPAASRFGLWMGIANKSAVRATFKTVAYVLILPFGLCVLSLCCGVLWPVVGLIKNILFINIGQDRLRRNFRRMVTERYSGGDFTASLGEEIPKDETNRKLPSVMPPDLRQP